MRIPLTESQQSVFDFIEEYLDKYRCSPTMREIAEALGYRSVNAAAQHVKTIENKGWVGVRRAHGEKGHAGSLHRGLFVIPYDGHDGDKSA